MGRDAAAIVLDLSEVDFVDSAGVRTLFRLARETASRGTRLLIVAPRDGDGQTATGHPRHRVDDTGVRSRAEALHFPYRLSI